MNYTMMVQGTMNFMGIEIPVVNGGFGENQLAVSDLTVSQLHDYEAKEIRRKTKDNIERFEFGVDVIDLKVVENLHDNLKGVDESHTLLEQMGYSKMMIGKADNIFIYSKRGYFKLVKLLNDDKSWDVYNDLVDDYFNMKLELQQTRPSYTIEDSVERAKRWIEEEEERRLLAKLLDEQGKLLDKQAPKVEVYDSFIDSNHVLGFRELNQQVQEKTGKTIKENELRNFLLDKGLITRNGNKYTATEYGVRNGYVVLKDFKNNDNGYSGTNLKYTMKTRELVVDWFSNDPKDVIVTVSKRRRKRLF